MTRRVMGSLQGSCKKLLASCLCLWAPSIASYASLPFQLSPLPSGSDYTCYFCSSSGQCWIKRHRHRNKEEED